MVTPLRAITPSAVFSQQTRNEASEREGEKDQYGEKGDRRVRKCLRDEMWDGEIQKKREKGMYRERETRERRRGGGVRRLSGCIGCVFNI